MTGLWVALSVPVDDNAVAEVLNDWFPHLEVGFFDAVMVAPPPWPPVVIDLEEAAGEFPKVVEFYDFPGPQDEAMILPVMIELARRFALAFSCDTLCDGSGHGDRPDYPGNAILWRDGQSYLADDYGTDFGDGEGGPVRVIRKLDLDIGSYQQILESVSKHPDKGETEVVTETDSGKRAHLDRLKARAEEIYDEMYEAGGPAAAGAFFSEVKTILREAIDLAEQMGLAEEAATIDARLEHIRKVYERQMQ